MQERCSAIVEQSHISSGKKYGKEIKIVYAGQKNQAAGGSHLLIEKFVKIHKCHRNILYKETAYLDKMLKEIEGHADDIEKERVSLAAEMVEPKTEMEDEREPNDGKPT